MGSARGIYCGPTGEETIRLRFDLRYDGSGFHGWAIQDGLRTVEGELSAAVQTVLREPVKFVVAGRTDAGVHAAGQVAHVDVDPATLDRALGGEQSEQSLGRFRDRLNRLLASFYASRYRGLVERGQVPPAFTEKGVSDVVVTSVREVSKDFDARFSATGRHYRYRIADRTAAMDPLRRNDTWWAGGDLDVDGMNRAAEQLLGRHDFLSFCKPRAGATTIRTLRELKVTRLQNGASDGVVIDVAADAFCHSMVRSLVGALVQVGRKKRDAPWVRRMVEDPSRAQGVPVAPARGLTLMSVDYPPQDQWAQRSAQARAKRTEDDVETFG